MKRKSLLAALLLGVAGLQTAFSQVITLHFNDRPAIEYSLDRVDSILFTGKPIIVDNHEFVDLELPSGTLWATTNVGADNPEDEGTFFAWGETEPKEEYSWSTYHFGTNEWLDKYNHEDGKTELEAEDDAATANWNTNWQIPLKNQLAELFDTLYTTTEWTTLNEVNGWRITSKQNGHSIFLPATGYYNYSNQYNSGRQGCYWSRSLYDENLDYFRGVIAYSIKIEKNSISIDRTLRYYGQSIRPIRVPLKPYDWPAKSIQLNKTELEIGRSTKGRILATVLPSYAKDTSVTWESSDENVATVGEDGTVTAKGIGSCTITCRSVASPDIKAECQVTVPTSGTTNEHEWVDLGLPSGTLWATTNVGADNPEDYGDYYAWGERSTKEDYSWSTYWFMDDNEKLTGYCTDLDYGYVDYTTWLQTTNDAGTYLWGRDWQMPSKAQFEEILDEEYTTWSLETRNGVVGWKIASKQDETCSIFIPSAGYHSEDYSTGEGLQNYYWTRTLDEDIPLGAYCFYFYNDASPLLLSIERHCGCSVRPVRKQEVKLVTDIEIPETSLCIEKGESIQLEAYVTPEDAENTGVVWIVTKGSAASVTPDGMLTGEDGGVATVTAFAADGSGERASCSVTVVGDLCPDNNHPHAIDLGLPSGTKWCCCNVGTSTPFNKGGYFAWGELTAKSKYEEGDYDYYNSSTKEYIDIGTDIAGTEYDAATSIMGAPWRMPTKEQLEELRINCTFNWYEYGSGWSRKKGCILTGTNGNQIFLPAAGEILYSSNSWDDREGNYWSSTCQASDNNYAYSISFRDFTMWPTSTTTRYIGLTIRAVRP